MINILATQVTRNAARLGLDLVRAMWTVINDFTPKRSMMELGFYLDAKRNQLLHSEDLEVRSRLEARLDAARAARSVMLNSNTPQAQIQMVENRMAALEELLRPPNPYRDVFAGSLSAQQQVRAEWRTGANQTGP